MKKLVLIFSLFLSLNCFAQYDDFAFEHPYRLGCGLLYNWYATQGDTIAPTGWHMPSKTEFETLETTLGGASIAGGKMKTTNGWNNPNTGATNESGFNARGSGARNYLSAFENIKIYIFIWLSTSFTTTAYSATLDYTTTGTGLATYEKIKGHSIRLIKDDSTNPGTLTDYDGNVYPTIKVGSQVWTALNWKCTHYRLGGAIPNVTDDTEWSELVTGAWCVYDNNLKYK